MSLEDAVRNMLNCACVAMGAAGWQGECCLEAAPPAFIGCCDDADADGVHQGVAWARLVDLTRDPLGPPPSPPDADPHWVLRVEVGMLTCVCVEACGCEKAEEGASRVLAFAEAALGGLACCDECNPPEIESLASIEGDGHCGGFLITATRRYTLCCPEPAA